MRLPTPFAPRHSQERLGKSEGPDTDPTPRPQGGEGVPLSRPRVSRPRVSRPTRNSRDWSPDSRDGPRHPGRVAPRRPTGLDAWAGAPRNGPSCEPALSLSASPSLKVGGEDLKAPGDKDGHDKTHECQQQHFHFVVSSAGGDMLGEQGTPSRSERLPCLPAPAPAAGCRGRLGSVCPTGRRPGSQGSGPNGRSRGARGPCSVRLHGQSRRRRREPPPCGRDLRRRRSRRSGHPARATRR